MTIQKLQNNFTTPEQSKRLLELGVPADSADYYLLRTHTKGDTFIVEVLHDELYLKKDKFTNMLEYLPCWSVCRLIEIYNLCAHGFYTLTKVPKDLIEHILSRYDWEIRHVGMDFSKLEE